jgi:hypothetical protein
MPEDNHRRVWGFDRRLFSLAALLLVISTTFAVNVNLNDNNSIEFGQGIYQIKACDQFISLEFKSTASINGYSRVGNIIFKGLDIDKCKGTAMRLRVYKTGVSAAQNLYTNRGGTETGTAVIMVISKTATRSTAADDVTLVDHKGVNIEYGDNMQAIDYDPANGNFMVSYAYPLAEMRYVNSVTLESASNV